MKTREILEKEYEVIDVSLLNNLDTPNKVKNFISIIINELINNKDIISFEKKENYIIKTIEKLFKHIKKERKRLIEYAEVDDKILSEISTLVVNNYNYFNKIYKLTNEDNHQEVLKLAMFLIVYFNNNLSFLEEKRTDNECHYEDFNYEFFLYEDNREVIDEFIKEKILILEENNKQYIRK